MKILFFRAAGITLAFAAPFASMAQAQTPQRVTLVSKEGLIGKVLPNVVADGFDFSPNKKRLTYTAKHNNKEFTVVDGVAGKEYDQIYGSDFSPNSKRFAYVAKSGEKEVAVIDGVQGKFYDNVDFSVTFSPDSKRTAYIVEQDDKDMVVVDGVEGKIYDYITDLNFSADSKSLFYLARSGTPENPKMCLVVNGVETKTCEGPNFGGFSPDFKHIAFVAKKYDDTKEYVVVDGVKQKEYDEVDTSVTFSSDNKHYAYAASRGNTVVMVVDGIERQSFEGVGGLDLNFSPTFSHDNKQLAFDAVRGQTGKEYIVLLNLEKDGKEEGKEYGMITKGITFSPDNRHLAYHALPNGYIVRGSIADTVMHQKNQELIVLDGVEGKPYENASWPSFSSDSQHMEYTGEIEGKKFLVVDGVEVMQIGEDQKWVAFSAPDTLSYWKVHDGNIYRVDMKIVSQ